MVNVTLSETGDTVPNAHAEYKGYRSVVQTVTVKDKRQYNTQETLRPVVITMARE
jgi:hypothetical protein